MQRDPSSTPIAVIGKNSTERVHVSLSEFKGTQLIDLRTYYTDSKGEDRATAKRICLRVGLLPELVKAVQAAEAEAIRLGLLPASGRA